MLIAESKKIMGEKILIIESPLDIKQLEKQKQSLKQFIIDIIMHSELSPDEISKNGGVSRRQIYNLSNPQKDINIKLDTFISLCQGISREKTPGQILQELIDKMQREEAID